jgi:hypothetical protein
LTEQKYKSSPKEDIKMKKKKPMLAIMAGAILFSLATLSACGSQSEPPRSEPATASMPAVPPSPERPQGHQQRFDVDAQFVASGWMGDGQVAGAKFIQLDEAWKGKPHSAPICIKVRYSPGPHGWAGIYWQNKADNWGDQPGENFSRAGYKRVTFWGRGETGGELVEFKAGGINAPGKKFRDSFEATTGKIALDTEWRQYEISLADKDLSSVIGGFCWVASKTANEHGLTFYIDDIYYEA